MKTNEKKLLSIDKMNKRNSISKICIITLVYISIPSISIAGIEQIRFVGNSHKVIKIIPDRKTGLDAIYVLNGIKDTSIEFESKTNSTTKWFSFNNLGGAFSEPINNAINEGNLSIINDINGDSGYIVETDNIRYYFWIVDYSSSPFKVTNIQPAQEQKCDATIIDFHGSADPIYYYTINGKRENLTRNIELKYKNLEWSQGNEEYSEIEITKKLPYISTNISIQPPVYCATDFEIIGDQFLDEWGMDISHSYPSFNPVAVMVESKAMQSKQDDESDISSNIICDEETSLGGSAPVSISFRSFTTNAVAHYEWQMSTDPEFENITHRVYDQDFDYVFTDEGTSYVRFIGSNDNGSCESFGEIYTIKICDSELKIPNAFSPGNDGINDIWKVSYRSILGFKCWIFDRQGHEIYSFDDPSKGWDGKYKGKYVKPGVYFYVIQATGSDGKNYKKSGDINILHKKNGGNNSNLGE